MKRRNFLQLLGAATLCSVAGITPLTDDELHRQLDAEFQRNLDDLAQRHNKWVAQHRAVDAESLRQMELFWGNHA